MIRIYSSDTTIFTSNGLGILKDTLSCIVEEELNGSYSLKMEYPQNGFLSEHLSTGNIIKVPCGHVSGNDQLFRIVYVSNNLTQKNITAVHIFYDLNGYMLEDVYPQDLSGAGALDWILTHTAETNNFAGLSDIETTASARYVIKNAVDSLIGTDNCFVKRWGGELLRDNFVVKILQNRGMNRGTKIRYGKNVNGITWDIDDTAVYTRIYPQGYDGLSIDEKYVDSNLRGTYPTGIEKVRQYEFSNIKIDEENGIDEAQAKNQLKGATDNLFEQGIDKPIVNISIDFIELSKVQEYFEKYSSFESIYLGDTVQAIIPYLNLNVTLKIIKTSYDCLLKKYISFEIGDVKQDYITSVADKTTQILNTVSNNVSSTLATAKTYATELLTNSFLGYKYITQNEIFIMDTDDPNTATNVWRWNLNGLGYSSTGINGPYNLAITMDGKIVADFITTGILNGELIKAGSITADKISTEILQFGGTNLIQNSVALFGYEFWSNVIKSFTNTEIQQNTDSKNVILTDDYGTATPAQIIQVQNGIYSVFFKYKKLIELATISIKINDYEIILDSLEWKEENYTFEVLSNTISIEIISDTDNSCWIGDLVCRKGVVAGVWSMAAGESKLGNVQIGSNIKLTSSASNIMQQIDNDGNRIININTNDVVTEYTDKGLKTANIESEKATIGQLLIQNVNGQVWFNVL